MPDAHVTALAGVVGERGLRTGAAMEPFLTDWRGRQQGKAVAVVLPASTAEVSAVVTYCATAGLKIYPQGGNTGLCAGAVPGGAPDGIVLGTARLAAIREIDPAGNVAVVEAGVPLALLHGAAEAADRTFPLHLGSEGTAQIGGLIATNAGGTGAVRYGSMRDMVLGLEAVLPDGSVVSRLGGLRKDNRGYDWKHLLAGSEGSLGIITAAALKLYPRLADEAHALCAVADPAAAVALFGHLSARFGPRIEACELVSGDQFRLALEEHPGLRHPLGRVPDWSVLVTLGDTDPRSRLETRLTDLLGDLAENGVILDAAIPKSLEEAREIWRLRHSLSEANRRGGHGIVFDIAVRVSAIPDFIARARAAVARIAPEAEPFIVSHMGDGNVHLIAMLRRAVQLPPADLERRSTALFDAIHDIADALGGSFSAEHGIGRKLVTELERRLDPAELALMRAIKRSIDPDNRMAPGVLLAAVDGADRSAGAAV